MTRVAIIQPNYIPWKGYFDIMHGVDVFVFLDDVQYTLRDWRNRNRIRAPDGSSRWISVPTVGGRNQRIADVRIDRSQDWARKHCETLRHSYGRTPFFARYFPEFVEIACADWSHLADLDIALTRRIAGWLGLEPRYHRSSELRPTGLRDERLIELVRRVEGTVYRSGPSARAYIRPEAFSAAGIQLVYHDYAGYPEYPQIARPFDHHVTILDLLFATGPTARDYIWGERRGRGGDALPPPATGSSEMPLAGDMP